MKKITVTTGFGYYKNQGDRVIGKAELPPGDHPLVDGFTYHEVNSQAELDAIAIWQDPAEIARAANNKKIGDYIRQKAINEMISIGDLPPSYVDD